MVWYKNVYVRLQEATGRYIVLYNYTAQDENDLTVERGQCVTVLNSDDPDWYWVSQFDGRDGFVPSGFIYPLDAIQRQRKYFYAKSVYIQIAQDMFSFVYLELKSHE